MSSKDVTSGRQPIRRRSVLAAGIAGAALAALPEGVRAAKAAGFLASDGQPTYAYVSTNSFTGTNPIGITVYQVNAKDGSLAPVQAVADAFPSWVTVDPNRRFLHACYALSNGTALVGHCEAYAIDAATGKLEYLSTVSMGATGPATLAVSPHGRYAVVTNYYYGQFVVLPIGEDGRLGPIISEWTDTGSGPNPRQDSAHPHAASETRSCSSASIAAPASSRQPA